MAYQISEKNQILLALFAIVVLCAGKLFKDYLYRGGYVEGLTVVPVSDTVLRRPADGNTIANLYLHLTLKAPLAIGGTITVSWPATISGVTMPAESAVTVTGITTTNKPITLSGANKILTLTNNGASLITSGSKIRINFTGVIIANGTTDITFDFTTTAGTESAVTTQIKILSSSTTPTAIPESTSAQEIRNAIVTINTRLAASLDPDDQIGLLDARSALVNVLAYTYGTIKEAGNVFDSDALYEAQKTAIDFIAKERKRAAANAQTLSQDNTNKRRMAQVNTYYTRNYEANTEVMKNIIYISVALIVLAVLRNKELIPASISTLGVIFILTMGGIVIGQQVFDIMRRNDHEFDKYDWNFNEDDMNNKFVQQSADPSKPMELGMGGACYGPGCCDVGTIWDAGRGRCASSGGAVWTPGTLTITMKFSQALARGDFIKITLPSGVFTIASGASGANGAIIASSAIASSSVTKTAAEIASEISLPVASGVAALAEVSITITGITVSSAAGSISDKNVTVATSKEPTKIPLRISGLV